MGLLNAAKAVGGSLVKGPKAANGGQNGHFKEFSNAELPWAGNQDSFFAPNWLETKRANGYYPYRLLVIDIKTKKIISGNFSVGGFSGTPSGAENDISFVQYKSNTGGIRYEITKTSGKWEFVLPITPQQLSVTDQFAINTSATMRGVVEEHNGVKFKMISASGTTGIWPTRTTFEDPNSGAGIPLFGGTVEAIGGALNALNTLLDGGKKPPQSLDINNDDDGQNTGYFQAMLLQQFLEQYAMAKKNPENKNWRLVFDNQKNNESFIVTPIQYTVTKSQRSPMEHLYNMQFKAWKRVDLNASVGFPVSDIKRIDSNFFQQINTALDNARSLMSASLNVIKAVRSDFRKPFDTLRKVSLFAKDFGGLANTLADLPNQIGADITSATRKRSKDLALASGGSQFGAGRTVSIVAQGKVNGALAAIKAEDDINEGLTRDEVESGVNGQSARDLNRVSPVNEIFNEPEANFDFFNSINVDELELTPQQQQAIEDEIELNSLLSVEDFKEFTQEIQELILDLSDSFGAGDEFFSEVYGRPAPKQRATPMTLEEFELIAALEEVVVQFNNLTATRELDDVRSQNSLEFIGGLADDSGITFESTSASKVLAPVPFGLSIEQIANRYLGDPDRYNEIVTLNNLRSPYIDEDGFFYNFLSNGDGNQFNIESSNNLYLGQKVQLSSNTIPVFTRKIIDIEKISDTNYLITVDGVSDLNLLTLSDQAKIKAYLPGTVNSQNQIFIPSNLPSDTEPRTFKIPGLEEDNFSGFSKIDWLLDDNGDVVINSFGEIGLANGITNIVQALKTMVITKKGQLLSAPSFGLGISPGVNVNDVSIQDILQNIVNTISQDSRFSGVDSIELNTLPPDLSISITVRLSGNRGIYPINFTVPL